FRCAQAGHPLVVLQPLLLNRHQESVHVSHVAYLRVSAPVGWAGRAGWTYCVDINIIADMSSMDFPRHKTLEVAQSCVCLYLQRAALCRARHVDEVFRPLDLTYGQFSLLMALDRPEPPTVAQLAPFLAMDRTTLTALAKPLQRRGLLEVLLDPGDRRKRRLHLSSE